MVRIGVMDIQVIDLEAGLGGSKTASPSTEGNKAPQSPKSASPTPQSPKAASPGKPPPMLSLHGDLKACMSLCQPFPL